MKKSLTRTIGVAVAVCALTTSFSAMAQQRGGGFDREALMQRMKDGIRTALEIKADDEWAIIGEKVDKVMAARTAVPRLGGGGFGGFTGGRPGGGAPGGQGGDRGGFGRGGQDGAQGAEQARGGDRGGQRGGDQARGGDQGRGGRTGGGRTGGRTGGFGGTPNPQVEALQKAVESGNEGSIKSALDALRREITDKEAALGKAQDELKELLTVKQEGRAMTMGLVR